MTVVELSQSRDSESEVGMPSQGEASTKGKE